MAHNKLMECDETKNSLLDLISKDFKKPNLTPKSII
jgi:hypothetical protein